MIPSSTMEDLALRFAVDLRAPLNTTNEAPVTFRSWMKLKPNRMNTKIYLTSTVFRILDILVRIRMQIRILGSVLLTHGSGSVSKSSVNFRMQQNLFFRIFKYFNKWNTYVCKVNMELDFQSLFGLHVHSSTQWPRPRNPPPSPPQSPAFGLIYKGAIGQPS